MTNKVLLTIGQSIALENYKCLEALKICYDETNLNQKFRYEYLRSKLTEKEIIITPAACAFVSLFLCSDAETLQDYVDFLIEVSQLEQSNKINMFVLSNYLSSQV